MVLLVSTLIATRSLRNKIMQQECIRKNPSQSRLTTAHVVTFAWIAFVALISHAGAQMAPVHPSMSPSSIALHQSLQSPCRTYVSASLESLMDVISKEQNEELQTKPYVSSYQVQLSAGDSLDAARRNTADGRMINGKQRGARET